MKHKVLFLFLFIAINLYSKIVVFVSIPPQYTFVKKIVKDKMDVKIVLDEGANAHNYTVKPSQIFNISKAEIYFAIGVEFEHIWLNKFKKLNKNLIVVNTDENISKLDMIDHNEHEHENESHDPHIWTSPSKVKLIARNILNFVIKFDDKNKDFYLKNYISFLEEINSTDKTIKSIFINLPKKKKFLVFHPSWQYFAKDYNLVQIAIEKNGKNPKLLILKNIINNTKKDKIKAIFVNKYKNNKTAKIISNELNIKLIKISTLDKDWSSNIIKLARQIEEY